MNSKGRKILQYSVWLAVMVVLLYFLFRGVRWADFAEGLRTCRIGFVLLAMLAGILSFWLRGVRWRQLIVPVDPSISRFTSFNAINIGNLANFVFPRIGEFVRCGVISRRSKANHSTPAGKADVDKGPRSDEGAGLELNVNAGNEPDVVKGLETDADSGSESGMGEVATYDKVLGTVVLERSWDVVTLFIFAALILVCRWGQFGSFVVEKMWTPLSERLDFSLWWIVGGTVVVLAAAIVIVVKLRDRSKACGAICRVCKGLLQGFTTAFHMKSKWKFFLNTVLIWGMYWLMAVFTMHAIPSLGGLNAIDALFLMIVGSFGWLIPVPGGFGSYHFIVALALQYIYGLSFSLGIVFATLSHESQAVTMMFCGLFSYLYETFRCRTFDHI